MTIQFQEVLEQHKKHGDVQTIFPVRSDKGSAGYDFYSKEDFVIPANKIKEVVLEDGTKEMRVVFSQHLFFTDIKALLPDDKVLLLDIRSGMGTKSGLMLGNILGVIDASYAGNPKNDGNIGICIKNMGIEDYVVKKGDKIAQGFIVDYCVTDDDSPVNSQRLGGFGSSGK